MDKLKRFIDCLVPIDSCILRCSYCFIGQERNFSRRIAKLKHSSSFIRQALSVERLGGVCLINMCSEGETLLSSELIDVVEALLKEGHYVMIVTNGILTNRLRKYAELKKDLLKRLMIKFSFHYTQLKERNLLDRFFNNLALMRDAGCSTGLELVPHDELIPYIDEIKKVCLEKAGALCHATVARDITKKSIEHLSKYPLDEYKNIWKVFDSRMFDFKADIIYKKRKEFCYAGDWTALLNLDTGDLLQCYNGRSLGNIYSNINTPVNFSPVGCHCKMPHCFNGHVYLTLGTIPELDTPSFDTMRDRVESTYGAWLKPEMKSFMSQKFKDNNVQIGLWRKLMSRVFSDR
jgi:hypothetical protein